MQIRDIKIIDSILKKNLSVHIVRIVKILLLINKKKKNLTHTISSHFRQGHILASLVMKGHVKNNSHENQYHFIFYN